MTKSVTLDETREAGAAAPARKLRLDAVSYLNAAPLVHGLGVEPRFDLRRALPSKVAEALHAGQSDLAMIPSIEYALGDYAIVPGIAITSRGPVRSVNLFLNGGIEDLRSVALDTSSRTSVALAKLLLRDRLGKDPEYLPMPPSVDAMLERCDGALVIGDPALDYAGPAGRVDLGELWSELTGLPFVWAFWAGRPDALEASDVRRLQRALGEGLLARHEIASDWAAGRADHAARNESYLRDNIVYALDDAECAGLRLFYARAKACRLIAHEPELRFYGAR